MKNLVGIVLAVTFTFSCDRTDTNISPVKDGTYDGGFYRSSPLADVKASNVTLTFDKGSFIGMSDRLNYPAICHGSYFMFGQEINFVNTCPLTDLRDRTMILSGQYQITVDGNNLKITRNYGKGTSDNYELVRR